MSDNIKTKVIIDGNEVEKEVIKRQNGFNPNNGQPVFEFVCQNGFDPYTGQPVYVVLERAGFDPYTGQPLFKVAPTPVAQKQTSNLIGQPNQMEMQGGVNAPSKQKSDIKKFLPVFIAIGALIVAAIVVIVGVFSGAFLSKRNKVALATYKTLNDSTIGKMLIDAGKLLDSDELTTEVAGNLEAYGYAADVDASVALNSKKSLIGVDAKVNVADMLDQSLKVYFDDSMLALSLPDISKDVFYYDYTSGNDGFVADLVYDYTEGDISDVDTMIRCLSELMKKSPEEKKATQKAIMKAYRQIEVSSIESAEFEVDDKDRKCKGYEMVITGENIAFLLSEVSEASSSVYDETLQELFEAAAVLTGMDMSEFDLSNEDTVDEMTEYFTDDMDDLVIDFYIYGGKLAAVEYSIEYEVPNAYDTVEEDGSITSGMDYDYYTDSYTLEFRGGDTRCSNIVASYKSDNSKKESVSLKSEIEGGTEEGSIYYNKTKILSYEYDTKSGSYSVGIPQMASVDGTLKVTGSELKAATDINVEGIKADLTVTVKNSAKISKPKGDYFDIGNADEDDFMEIAEELADELGSLFGGGLYGIGNEYMPEAAPAAIELPDYDYGDYDYDNPDLYEYDEEYEEYIDQYQDLLDGLY